MKFRGSDVHNEPGSQRPSAVCQKGPRHAAGALLGARKESPNALMEI